VGGTLTRTLSLSTSLHHCLAPLLLTLSGCQPALLDSAADTRWSVELVTVPQGAFLMGCDPAGDPLCGEDEQPQHRVELSAYGIMRTEVSQAAWQACVDDGACDEPLLAEGMERHPQLPVTGLVREMAQDFCEWADLRLPTEAEWEKAARGEDGQRYPWGEAAPDCSLAHGRGCGDAPLPVDSLEAGASPYGALHMSGNAWEWVSDSYDPLYYQDSPAQDPTGPTQAGLQQIRGVSVYSDPATLRAADRQMAISGMACPLCGLRCAGDPP
jgi:formylglycine-generating enzyme required for sulfatase activity